jgi:hypothetical protein
LGRGFVSGDADAVEFVGVLGGGCDAIVGGGGGEVARSAYGVDGGGVVGAGGVAEEVDWLVEEVS